MSTIGVGGETEICGNGEDDDCDGLIDCEDPDCAVRIFNLTTSDPTCPICNNGSISIQAFSNAGNVTASISPEGQISCLGGSCNTTNSLSEGTYTITLTNGSCTTEVEVILSSIGPQPPETDCENGGFSNGDFVGWTGIQGNILGGEETIFGNTSPNEYPGYTLIRDGEFINSFFPSIFGTESVNSPTGGTYMAMLGETNLNSGNNTHHLKYCFVVTEDNADFSFNYSLVLSNPEDHEENEKPFFSWTITQTSTDEEIISKTNTAGVDIFDVEQNGLSMQGWTCEAIDLSAYIDEEVCIEFVMAQCGVNNGIHGGYAFIDGICQNSDDNGPNCDFELQSSGVCSLENVDLIFSTLANNFTEYSINICDQNGTCSSHGSNNGFVVDPINIIELVGDDFNFESEQDYTIEVTLENNCGSCTSSYEFTYFDFDMSLNYPEWLVVCGNPEQVIIPGSSSCSSCNYSWSPANNLANPDTQNPTILGGSNVNAYDELYTLTMTSVLLDNEETCIQETAVNVTTNPFTNNFTEPIISYCSIDFEFTITAPFDIFPSDFDFQIFDINNRISHSFTGVQINSNTIEFDISVSRDAQAELDPDLMASYKFYGNQNAQIVGEFCTYQERIGDYPRGIFTRGFRAYVPTGFSPNDNGIDDTFYPFFSSPQYKDVPCGIMSTESSVYKARFHIYDRQGGNVWDATMSVPITDNIGLLGEELAWDGKKYNSDTGLYEAYPIGVYNWVIEAYNCEVGLCNSEFSNCGDPVIFCSNGEQPFVFSGDVTILY